VAAAGLHATFNNTGALFHDRKHGRSCFVDSYNKLRANRIESMKSLISLHLPRFR
jgi:hypothetical protein